MEQVFKKTYKVETIHLDRYGRLKPSAMLYFAQEVATGHCDLLQLGWETLAEKGVFWVVVRTRLQVDRMPVAGESLTVETWPMPTTRSAFPRATAAYDREGKPVFRCLSLWVLVDIASRKMVLPANADIALEGVVRGGELAVPGSFLPKEGGTLHCRNVVYTDLDKNGHVNNTRYIDWVDDLLDSQFHREHSLKEMTVCYQSEALEGDKVALSWQIADGPALMVDAHRVRTDGHHPEQRVFSVRMQF